MWSNRSECQGCGEHSVGSGVKNMRARRGLSGNGELGEVWNVKIESVIQTLCFGGYTGFLCRAMSCLQRIG